MNFSESQRISPGIYRIYLVLNSIADVSRRSSDRALWIRLAEDCVFNKQVWKLWSQTEIGCVDEAAEPSTDETNS